MQGPSENEGDGGIWRLVKNTRTRVDDFEPLNMFKGIIFLVSVFLKLNSDDFPFFRPQIGRTDQKLVFFEDLGAPH